MKQRTVTQMVMIRNRQFALIELSELENAEILGATNGIMYGTIPYEEIDENGKLKRMLNGFEMVIRPTIGQALAEREFLISIEGLSETEKIMAIINKK